MERVLKIRQAALAAVAALRVVGRGRHGVRRRRQHRDRHPPRPAAPPVIVVERPAVVIAPAPVVVEYNTYCVGYRANLYDADWRSGSRRWSSSARRRWTPPAATRARSR